MLEDETAEDPLPLATLYPSEKDKHRLVVLHNDLNTREQQSTLLGQCANRKSNEEALKECVCH